MRACFDQQRVEFFIDEGLKANLAEARKIKLELAKAIEKVERRAGPPAPRPIYLDENHKIMQLSDDQLPDFGKPPGAKVLGAEVHTAPDEIASVGEELAINGIQMDLEDALALRDWINKAEDYFRGGKNV